MQNSFVRAVDYRTYSVKNRSQRYNSKIASQVAKLVEKLRSQLKKMDFDKMNPISILASNKEYETLATVLTFMTV